MTERGNRMPDSQIFAFIQSLPLFHLIANHVRQIFYRHIQTVDVSGKAFGFLLAAKIILLWKRKSNNCVSYPVYSRGEWTERAFRSLYSEEEIISNKFVSFGFSFAHFPSFLVRARNEMLPYARFWHHRMTTYAVYEGLQLVFTMLDKLLFVSSCTCSRHYKNGIDKKFLVLIRYLTRNLFIGQWRYRHETEFFNQSFV